MKPTLALAGILALTLPTHARQEKKAEGEFAATASIGTRSGTRSMAFDVVVTSPRSLAEILPLKRVLEDGGQQALVNAIRGSGQGQIKLGALVYPIDLVMAEKIEDGWRYLVVTTRPISIPMRKSIWNEGGIVGSTDSDWIADRIASAASMARSAFPVPDASGSKIATKRSESCPSGAPRCRSITCRSRAPTTARQSMYSSSSISAGTRCSRTNTSKRIGDARSRASRHSMRSIRTMR